jgi:protein-S-isoprenylcysteine O-methyltransferase Ste14
MKDIPGIVAPPPLLYGAGLGIGFLIDHWYPRTFLPSRAAHPLGIALFGLGLFGLIAIFGFRRAGTSPNPWMPTQRLVTSGIYRITRNPMYIGFTLWYLAVTCWFNSLWPLVVLPVVVIVMHFGVILREERYLEGKFGEEYREYRGRVRRWV